MLEKFMVDGTPSDFTPKEIAPIRLLMKVYKESK
ncbi:hypothetical protein PhaeoP97_02999 [Phaeobacter porticola]|uniref:Uncharacterized protein n=1 Tax=Phaeobacter porticola TaxID=1844006 RepID=A0A1L3I8B4_9RHOB|nr:hypothetical protein PhaeoP97_02999 [Phaeobacter porticola]AUQ44726.1 hypothetical protein PhaeoP10_00356 [Phaeobacter inhibens]